MRNPIGKALVGEIPHFRESSGICETGEISEIVESSEFCEISEISGNLAGFVKL